MNKRKAFLAVLAFGLIIISLSGCQDIINQIPFLQEPSARETQIVKSATPTAGAVFQQAPSPIPQQTNNLTFWIPPQFDPNSGTPAGNLFKNQIENFTLDHPGVTVNVRIKAVSGPGGLLDSLSTASSAAPAILPGLVLLSRSDLESAANNGLLLPLDATDLNLNTQGWFPFATEISQARDTSYGIPFAGNALVLAYKPLQIGYPPLLWQDIIQQQSILAIPASDPRATIPLLLYMSLGGNFGRGEQNVTLQEAPLQSSLQTFSDGAVANVFPYWLTEYNSFDQTWQALKDSRAAYAIIWSSQYLGARPENVTITPLPVYKDQIFTLADGWVLAFPQSSPERYLAHLALAEYLIEPEFQQTWSEAAGVLPVSREALSRWKDTGLSGILFPIAESARLIPSNNIIDSLGELLSNAAQELIRKQVGYIQATNSIIKDLSE